MLRNASLIVRTCIVCKDVFIAHYNRQICNACRPEALKILHAASRKTKAAVKTGELLDPSLAGLLCSYCGEKAYMWEHRDYARPLDVVPSCHSCNCKVGAGQRSNHSRYQSITKPNQQTPTYNPPIKIISSGRSAGRPPLVGAKRIVIKLDRASIERAKAWGGGKNVSAGIRAALKAQASG